MWLPVLQDTQLFRRGSIDAPLQFWCAAVSPRPRGLDAALMIEFSHMAMKICATIGVPMCLLMGPAHWFFGGMPEEQARGARHRPSS